MKTNTLADILERIETWPPHLQGEPHSLPS
jgi:hypothetical protein